jgi:hypothetical protein
MRCLKAVLLVCVLSTPAWSQDGDKPFSYNLGVKMPDNGPNMPNLRLNLDKRGMVVDENFTSVKRWRTRGRIDLTTRADQNPDDSFAEGAFGLVKPWLNNTGTERLIFGFYVDGRAESNQSLSESLASLQVRTIVSHLHRKGAGMLLPQVEVAWGATWAVKSDVQDALSAESATTTRLDAEAYWNVPLRGFTAGLPPITLGAELRGFLTSGLDPAQEALGFDDGAHAAVTASYAFKLPGFNGVFVRWSRGRLPTQPVLASTWQFGVLQ